MENTGIDRLYSAYHECGGNVCTDTRRIIPGAIFFALRGDNFNANTLASKALEGGCRYAVVDDEAYCNNDRTLLVKDSLAALQELATCHRRTLSIPVLAITGSNAKTTSKELINAVLSQQYNTLYTAGNLNNHIGVPLTLLRLKREHEFAIIEMGANHQGEIAMLCEIAEPTYGLITNIGKAHLEGFGGIEGVKKGKSELYRFIKGRGGRVFVNGDDETLYQLAFDNDKITYGSRKFYDYIGKECSDGETVSLKYTTRYGEKDWKNIEPVHTRLVGHYNYVNCLAAVAVGLYFKVEEEKVRKALEGFSFEMNRSQLVRTEKNVIILDAYNANPNSMKAAIENFVKFNADKKLALLGDMFELGSYSEQEHQQLADMLKESGLEVMLVGASFMKVNTPFRKFSTTDDCMEHLRKNAVEGRAILIKGSRGMKMERLQEAL